jgi:hypothetical protein
MLVGTSVSPKPLADGGYWRWHYIEGSQCYNNREFLFTHHQRCYMRVALYRGLMIFRVVNHCGSVPFEVLVMYRNAMLHIFLLVSYILNHPNF